MASQMPVRTPGLEEVEVVRKEELIELRLPIAGMPQSKTRYRSCVLKQDLGMEKGHFIFGSPAFLLHESGFMIAGTPFVLSTMVTGWFRLMGLPTRSHWAAIYKELFLPGHAKSGKLESGLTSHRAIKSAFVWVPFR